MSHIQKNRYGIRIVVALVTALILVAGGIPAVAQDQPEAHKFTDPNDPGYENPIANYDPWEGFNRAMYKFNYGFDKYFFIPVVDTYRFILPKVVRTGIANFFDNLYEIRSVVNNLLQGDAEGTFNATARIAFNTTIGIAGILDPATPMGFPKDKEDFGQTLGKWGLGPGPYLVLPFLGPSSVRDGIGTGVDASISTVWVTWVVNEVYTNTGDRDKLYWGLTGLYYISERARIPFRYYSTGSPFEYDYVRYVYLKYRQIEIGR
jgi:phospholipid-binding lipoprotein MlaA